MSKDAFFLNVAHALSGCQLVEQELKLYITEALDFVRQRLDDRMPFKMCGENYANSSLEGLISIFQKLTRNVELVNQLGKFKEERNFLSHKGIAACFDYDGEFDYPTALDMQPRLDGIKIEAERLRHAIHEEGSKIERCRPADFDDVSEQ